MSITLRPYRSGGGEADITIRLPDGSRYRERKRASRFSKLSAQRWAQDRERYLLQHGPPTASREVTTLEAFAPRFVDGHARANRHKPSGIASVESILKWHLVPTLGPRRLDAITNDQVQRQKLALSERAPKTVNNVLTVLSTLLKKAVEWGELERLPCVVKLLPNPKKTMGFHDFDQYERLLTVARKRGTDAHLMVLAGGDAGLRLGEIIALEWRDIDLAARRLTVERSGWQRHVTVPKGGRSGRTDREVWRSLEHSRGREIGVVSVRGCAATARQLPRDHGSAEVGAGYGDRTRLAGLGSQSITTMLSPRAKDRS
jgi:integrase